MGAAQTVPSPPSGATQLSTSAPVAERGAAEKQRVEQRGAADKGRRSQGSLSQGALNIRGRFRARSELTPAPKPPSIPRRVAPLDANLDFHRAMKDPHALAALRAFATAEHSEENVVFYDKVQQFRHRYANAAATIGSAQKQWAMIGEAKAIVDEFLRPSAIHALNLPASILRKFEKGLYDSVEPVGGLGSPTDSAALASPRNKAPDDGRLQVRMTRDDSCSMCLWPGDARHMRWRAFPRLRICLLTLPRSPSLAPCHAIR